MKKYLKFGSVMTVALAALTFTSCEEEAQNDTISEQSFLRCYAVMTDKQALTQNIANPVTIKLELNWTQATAVATINGLPGYSTLTVSDMKWGIDDDKWSEIDQDIVTAKTATGTPVTISDFEMKWFDRLEFAETVGEYDPALEFSFNLDNRYTVAGSRAPFYVTGKTVSTPADGAAYTYDQSIYATGFDFTNKTAAISITGAKFDKNMPAMNISFTKIPFTMDNEGKVYMSIASITPTLTDSNAPFNDFPVTDLRAEIEPGNGMDLSFKCNFRGTIYTVKCDLDFTSYLQVIE